jgi:hypothetical protein
MFLSVPKPESQTFRKYLKRMAGTTRLFITGDPNITHRAALTLLEAGPPPKDFFQQALLYLQERARSARRCANSQCAQEPYFFAEKPNQKYCSEICSNAARLESKKNWWDLHGSEWREEREKARKKQNPGLKS